MLQVALGLPQEEDESTLRDRGSTTVAQILVEIPLSTSCDSIITTTTSEEDPTTTTIPTLIDAIIVELEERLDPIACRILHSREEQEQQNVLAAPSEWQQRLPDDDDEYEYDLPEWWTMNGALTDECTLLRSILNEDDFTKDLLRLASTTSSSATNTCSISWSQVKVVLVGPSGIILRATSSSPSSTTTTIPIRFDTIATTSEMLRSLVLDLVEEEEQPQAKDAAEKPVVGTPLPPPPLAEETMDETTMTTTDMAVDDVVRRRRQQPKSPQEEAQLAAKYAAISNLGDRAYTILKDLGMI